MWVGVSSGLWRLPVSCSDTLWAVEATSSAELSPLRGQVTLVELEVLVVIRFTVESVWLSGVVCVVFGLFGRPVS